jgi:hypothetical protein
MPRDPYIREKFTKNLNAARKHAAEYFQCFPKDRYQTEVESWRELQSQNIEFTMKRLGVPLRLVEPGLPSSEGWQRRTSDPKSSP